MSLKIYDQTISLNEKSSTSLQENQLDRAVVFRIDQSHVINQSESLLLSQIFACFLLVPVLPLIAVCVILTKLSSKGPAFYTQERVGIYGKVFTIYKIRSMKMDAESKSGAVWARSNDPRITRLGKFLRWSHLDELPQLFNVLKGEMSFIGPRPERPQFVQNFITSIDRYDERLHSYPGITGIAQVCLPPDDPDAGLKTVCDKLSLEIAYQEQKQDHKLLDLRILMATALKIMGIPRHRYTSWLALNHVTPVEIKQKKPARRVAA
jgi:lipopolysaccharide/colanic/teichoic acid biosynthesis glycosyltransferase